MTIKSEIQSLSPSALIELFILDSTNLPGGSISRFHAGVNGLQQPIVWQGQTYEPLPIDSEGFDVSTQGSLPRPKLRVANVGGILSASVKEFGDFVGCKLIRKRTFAKYLDEVNFPARRNMLRFTSDFTNAAWTNNPLTATQVFGVNAMLAPDGSMTADTTSSATGTRYQGVSVVGDTVRTQSYHVRPANPNSYVRIYVDGNIGAGSVFTAIYVDIQCSTGKVRARSTNVGTFGSISLGDGWYRVWMTYTPPASGTAFSHVYPIEPELTGWWGFQNEEGTLTDYQAVNGSTFSRNPSADPNQFLPDDLWYIERKLIENRHVIEFELSSAFDLMGQQLPNRQIIQNSCSWRYRSAECGWTGGFFDINNNPVASSAQDSCAKTLAACKVRFGVQPIRFGGFPGAVRGIT